jgi:predicted lipase
MLLPRYLVPRECLDDLRHRRETVPKGIEETPIDRVVTLQLVGLFCNCAMHVVLSAMKQNDIEAWEIEALQSTFLVAMAIAFGFIYSLVLPPWWRNRKQKLKLDDIDRAEAWLLKRNVIQKGFKYYAAAN